MRAHRVVSLGFVLLAAGSAALALRPGVGGAGVSSRAAPRRIVAGSGALAEILFAIGAGDLVVARSHFTTYPPAALALPDVGGAMDPNLEAVESARPDLILLQQRSETVDAFAAEREIPVLHFRIETIADVLATTGRLGDLTGHRREADAEVSRLRGALAACGKAARSARPRVLVSVERTPGDLRSVPTLGSGTFVMECVEAAGGLAAVPKARGYSSVSKEAVLEAKPDAVIELRTEPASPDVEAALVRDWEAALPELAAVRKKRVRVVSHEAALTPGPRLDQVVLAIARALGAGP